MTKYMEKDYVGKYNHKKKTYVKHFVAENV